MKWYYESGGQQQGPVSEADLDRLAAEGKITADTLVWRDGLADWQPLREARPPRGEDTVRCASCGEFFPPAEVIEIGDRTICSRCKPAVLQSLQQGTLLPSLGDEARTGPAWEQRQHLGMAKAIWETIRAVLLKPAETFATMKRVGGFGSPLLFAAITSAFVTVVSAGYRVFAQGRIPRPEIPPGMEAFVNFVYHPSYPLAIFVALPITLFVGSGFSHLCLTLCGGARQPYETTFRVYAYVHGATIGLQLVELLNLIPVAGSGLADTLAFGVLLWMIIIIVIGVAQAHETEMWRSLLAFLIPMFVCCSGGVVLLAGSMAMAMRGQ